MRRLAVARRQAAISLRVVRAAMRNAALRRVQVAFLLFSATVYGTWVAVLLYAYDASGPGAVGIVALVQLVPAAVLAPLLASLADRFARDRVLFSGYLAQTVAFGATGIGMLEGAPPILVYVAATIAVASLAGTRPAQGSLLPDLARTPEELTAANGLSGAVEGTGVLVGPLAAALILAVATPGTVFMIGAGACLLAATLVFRLPRPSRPEAAASTPSSVEGDEPVATSHAVLGGARALREGGDTRLIVGILALRMVTSGAMDVLFVLLALEAFHTGASGAGILNAALGLGTVLGGAASFALVGRQQLAPALALGALTWGAAIVLVGTVATAWAAPIVVAAGGIGYAAVDVAGRTVLQRVTAPAMLGRVLGALEGVGLVGLATGSVAVPVIAGIAGIEATTLAAGLLLPAGVGLAWAGLRRIDRQVRVPVREIALLRANAVFAPLPAPQLESVARRTRWITVERGEVLIREGDVGDRYYVHESGLLRVTQAGRQLRDVGVRGDGIGEIALLHDVARSATVTAVQPCVMLALERADFLEAVTGHEQVREIADRVATERAAATAG